MLDQLIGTFPELKNSDCLNNLTESVFYIFDTDSGRCICHSDPKKVIHVTVNNDTNNIIYFLAVDSCFFLSSDPERCDCLLFTNKLCCFIEIKIVDFKSGNAARRKAKSQLESSINYFKKSLDLASLRLRAYACVGKIEPRPSITATDINERARFAKMGVELFHGNVVDV